MISNGGRDEQQLLAETRYSGYPAVPDDNSGGLDRLPAPVAVAPFYGWVGLKVLRQWDIGYRRFYEHGRGFEK